MSSTCDLTPAAGDGVEGGGPTEPIELSELSELCELCGLSGLSGLSDLEGGVAALAGSLEGLGGRGLADRLVQIERLRRKLEAATVAVLDEADRTDAYRDDGHFTVGAWARATVNWSRRETTDRVRTVQLTRLCPIVAGELGAGRLGVAQTFELGRARANPRVGDQIADTVAELVRWATELGFDGFRQVVARWEQLADVDGAHQGHEAAHRGRRATITGSGDTFHLIAQFGVIQGTAMAKILEAFSNAEFHADWEQVKAEHGDDATPAMITRTPAQQRADALYAIFMAAVSGEPVTLPDPVVNLVCDLQTFEEHLARLTNNRVPAARSSTDNSTDPFDPATQTEPTDPATQTEPTDPCEPDDSSGPAGAHVSMGTGFGLRRCETVDGVAVDPGDVVAAALVGHVRRVVINAAGVVVNCGRKTRLFTGVARQMVWLLGTTCCWPGCGHRVGIQIDHLAEYSQHGLTNQANADPLDGRHNRFKTANGYRITRDNHGILHTYRPDGTEIKPV